MDGRSPGGRGRWEGAGSHPGLRAARTLPKAGGLARASYTRVFQPLPAPRGASQSSLGPRSSAKIPSSRSQARGATVTPEGPYLGRGSTACQPGDLGADPSHCQNLHATPGESQGPRDRPVSRETWLLWGSKWTAPEERTCSLEGPGRACPVSLEHLEPTAPSPSPGHTAGGELEEAVPPDKVGIV